MAYEKLFTIIDDSTKLKSFISNMASGCMDIPYIMKETLSVLDDDSILSNIITDSNKKALCIMMDQYFNDCYDIYIEDVAFDKLLKFGKIEVYKIAAANGLRYATVNEIAQGTKGLIGEYIYPAGEDAYKKLCLLYWSFTGISYYFREAGYKLDYTEDGKVKNTFYEMIQMCAYELKDLFTWLVVRDDYNKAIKKIEKMKKSKGYKYATYEKDEITEDITIKQLVYNIYKVFPRNSSNREYRRALAIALKAYKDKKKLQPLEIATLRDIYDKHALDTGREKQQLLNESDDLKNECELLLRERYSGKINSSHFAYTIIDTLKKSNYSKCSPKQYSIIEEALKAINKDDNKDTENGNNEAVAVISDTEIDSTLASLSNAIGQGMFEEEEE